MLLLAISVITRIINLLSTLLALWFVGFVFFMLSVPESGPEPTTKADAAVVFTGGSLRIGEGLRLLQNEIVDELFISGVGPGVSITQVVYSNMNNPDAFLQKYGSRIKLGYEAGDTIGNAEESARWLMENNKESIYLITANYHIARSSLELQSKMPDITIIDHPVVPENIKIYRVWQHSGSLKLLFLEYNKLIIAILRNGVLQIRK